MLNLLKQLGSAGRSQDATLLLSEDLVLVEQRVEPAKKAAQIIYKKLCGCLQSQQGLDAERRMKKLPLMMLSVSTAESLKDFDPDSSIRKALEMCCFMENFLARTLADFEVQLEKEVLEPLNKLSEEDLPEILRNKKQFARLTMEWHNARSRAQASTGPQAKQDGLREEVEEAWRRLENIKDQYSADLYHFATKEDTYANYFIRLLELQVGYHKTALGFLEKNIQELKENHKKSEPQLDNPSGKVYGVPLLAHLTESGRDIAVPIQECVRMLLHKGMREEGLFRLAAAASVVKKLKKSLDHGNADPSEFSTDPHAVAGALKSYLRELPEPLMTFELYDEWFEAAGEKEVSDRLEQLKGVLKKLPRENYNNLRYLVQFLAHLSKQQAVNRMTPSNIAIVLGPNLLWPRTEGGESLIDMASASSVQVVTVIEPLIQYAQSLFPEAEDFEVPELPVSPNLKQAPLKLLKPEAENPTTPSPSSPPSCPDSCTVPKEENKPALVKTKSGSNCTISWENPYETSVQKPTRAQNPAPNRDQNQKTESSHGQNQPPSLPVSIADKLHGAIPVVSLPEDRSPIQQHHSPSPNLDKEQGVSGLSKPTTPVSPPAQPAGPKSQQQPHVKSLNKKPVSKKGAIRPPNFPPPEPPPLVSRQVPPATQ
ncbi:SH3 domain-binding protein 1 isoform X2 [Scleropages formosus]|uniref:SH3 domain binding protein 1 n=1 Tax=Scleropages formosus TaxID=113540 RepID=A0A8C9RW24_SCLFO|nr:SH3 domain-binding protein 1-like isoform X2 [Scleropages formosus]